MLIRLFNPNDLIGCGGDINQSKSVPMMSLNVVGNIYQSNFRRLHGSLQVSVGGLCGSSQVSVGLHGWSLQVSAGLHKWSPWVVSTGLHRWSPQVSAGLHRWFGSRGQGK